MKIEVNISRGYGGTVRINAIINKQVLIIEKDVAEKIIRQYLKNNKYNTTIKGKQIYKRITI